MSNALSMFHGSAVATVSDLDAILARGSQNRPQVASGGKPFLRLHPDGEGWIYGADSTQVEDGSRWAVNPYSFQTGWVCWADPKKNGNRREKLGEVMGSIANPPSIPETDHSAKGGSWSEQFGFILVCVHGEDAGTEVVFQATSYGGKAAYDAVFQATANRPSPEYCFPIVELLVSSYMNKTYGKKVYAPVFEIVDWANTEQAYLSGNKPEITSQVTSEAADKVDASAAAPEAEAPLVRRRRAV